MKRGLRFSPPHTCLYWLLLEDWAIPTPDLCPQYPSSWNVLITFVEDTICNCPVWYIKYHRIKGNLRISLGKPWSFMHRLKTIVREDHAFYIQIYDIEREISSQIVTTVVILNCTSKKSVQHV